VVAAVGPRRHLPELQEEFLDRLGPAAIAEAAAFVIL